LTIDGGGIKGAFPASFLAAVEEATDKSIVNYFDLIVGTSTGGIIALGLAMGWPARDLSHFYKEYGPKIFQKSPLWLRCLSVLRAKYSPEPLHQALEQNFGERRIGESVTRLVIPSVNLDTGEVYLYKTAHHPSLKTDYREKAIDAARATSAAPRYFPSFISDSGIPLIDGGVWANNPIAVAVVEAITLLEWSSEEIEILSLGCTTEPIDFQKARRKSKGMGYWARNVTELFMCTQSSSASGMAKLLLGGNDRILRINPVTSRGRFALDKTEGIQALCGLGETEARKALPILEERFLHEPAAEFEPYHKL
jgi:patatin-like phospholipase/acyl hydrolase